MSITVTARLKVPEGRVPDQARWGDWLPPMQSVIAKVEAIVPPLVMSSLVSVSELPELPPEFEEEVPLPA